MSDQILDEMLDRLHKPLELWANELCNTQILKTSKEWKKKNLLAKWF